MSQAATTSAEELEATVKLRNGKKWKKRYCVFRKGADFAADAASLHVYKNAKILRKTDSKKRAIHLSGFCGLESRFLLDDETRTLAIICQSETTVLAFDVDHTLLHWEMRIRNIFGYGCQYSVIAYQLPQGLSSFEKQPLRLHLRDGRLSLVADCPPRLIATLRIRDLRRFGAFENKYCVEAGDRTGPLAGLYIFRTGHIDQMTFTVHLAAYGRLHSYLSNDRNSNSNTAAKDGEDARRRNSSGPADETGAERKKPPESKATSSRSFDMSASFCAPSGRHPFTLAEKSNLKCASAACGKAIFDTDNYCDMDDVQNVFSFPPRQETKNETGDYCNKKAGTTFALVSKYDRPYSVGHTSPPLVRKCSTAPPLLQRPLSEVCANACACFREAAGDRGARNLICPLPVRPSCQRCRNYVNQTFIESLQFYYNIDHVVLALSKKSKCCEHECAAERKIAEDEAEATDNIVNVPTHSYAAMAPRGSLYVRMDSRSRASSAEPSEFNGRSSVVSVPPDDPRQTDEEKAVTVPSSRASAALAATSGVIVKPFEPLVIRSMSRDSSKSAPCPMSPDYMQMMSKSVQFSNNAKTFPMTKNERNSTTKKSAESNGPFQRATRSESPPRRDENESRGFGGVWRSTSFAVRNSSIKTKTFFGALARRASSKVFHSREQYGAASRSPLGDCMDERQARTRSEPPMDMRGDPYARLSHGSKSSMRRMEREQTLDLDEVVYDGAAARYGNRIPDHVLRSIGLRPLVSPVKRRQETVSKSLKLPIAPQRSIGTDSTLSSDSQGAVRSATETKRSAQLNSADLNSVLDSVSVGSDNSDSDSVFVNNPTSQPPNAKPVPVEKNTKTDTIVSKTKTPSPKPQNLILTPQSRRDVMTRPLSGSYSCYDGDGSSDSPMVSPSLIWTKPHHADTGRDFNRFRVSPRFLGRNSNHSMSRKAFNTSRRRMEYLPQPPSPPAPLEHAPPPPMTLLSNTKKLPATIEEENPISSRAVRSKTAQPPFSAMPRLEGQIFKFPPAKTLRHSAAMPPLNYALLAQNAPGTPPFSAGGPSSGPSSVCRTMSTSLLLPGTPAVRSVEYAKIDEVATHAARQAVTTSRRHDNLNRWSSAQALSEGDQSGKERQDTSSIKGKRNFRLRRPKLGRRTSFASLTGV